MHTTVLFPIAFSIYSFPLSSFWAPKQSNPVAITKTLQRPVGFLEMTNSGKWERKEGKREKEKGNEEGKGQENGEGKH